MIDFTLRHLICAQNTLYVLLLAITGCNGIDINVIPEVFDPPNDVRDGAFYGASLALCPNKFYVGAPFPARGKTGMFSCDLGTQRNCRKDLTSTCNGKIIR